MMKFILAAVFAASDLTIKDKIESSGKLPLEFHGIRITKVHNYGFAFNLFDKYPPIAKMVSAIVLIISGVFLGKQKNTSKGFLLGSALFLGGAASNTIDRIKRGYVVDYITFTGTIFKKYVYNLGDFFLVIGGILLSFFSFPKDKA